MRGPCPQHGGIDVYFQAKVDGNVVSFIVEDKTGTEMHGGQLERYPPGGGGRHGSRGPDQGGLLQRLVTCSTTNASWRNVPATGCSRQGTWWLSSRRATGRRRVAQAYSGQLGTDRRSVEVTLGCEAVGSDEAVVPLDAHQGWLRRVGTGAYAAAQLELLDSGRLR